MCHYCKVLCLYPESIVTNNTLTLNLSRICDSRWRHDKWSDMRHKISLSPSPHFLSLSLHQPTNFLSTHTEKRKFCKENVPLQRTILWFMSNFGVWNDTVRTVDYNHIYLRLRNKVALRQTLYDYVQSI